MGWCKLGLAGAAAFGLVVVLTPQPVQAQAARSLMLRETAPEAMILVAQEGPRFHHGRRAQSVYCLQRNYWWFYRPYTTAPEDFPRCEPYFHYLEPTYDRRGAWSDGYFK
jgi:hypothetical protein